MTWNVEGKIEVKTSTMGGGGVHMYVPIFLAAAHDSLKLYDYSTKNP